MCTWTVVCKKTSITKFTMKNCKLKFQIYLKLVRRSDISPQRVSRIKITVYILQADFTCVLIE